MTLAVQVALQKAERALVRRVEELEARVQAGEVALWPDYLEAVKGLAAIAPVLTPENGGPMLTTGEMAARLGIAPKTLLRRRKQGEIRPAVASGKFLRWRGNESLTPGPARKTPRTTGGEAASRGHSSGNGGGNGPDN